MSGLSPSLSEPRPLASGLALLRLPALGWLWRLSAVAGLALLWQQAIGWPGTVRWTLKTPAGAEVQAAHYPTKTPPERWDLALVRVTRNGQAVARYVQPEMLAAAPGEGYVAKGHYVYLRSGDAAAATWVVSAPWSMPPWRAWGICAGLLAWTALLWVARHPMLREDGERLRAWCAHPRPALALAAVAAIVAVLVRARGFSFPDWQNDSLSYFRSIYSVANGGPPLATPDRPFAYSWVMGHLLRWMPDFRAIVTAQGLATLVAGSAVGALVWLSGERLFAHPALRALGRLLGVAAFAALTLDEAVLEREWALLAEAWAAFYLGVQAGLVWWLTARRRALGPALGGYAVLCACGLLTLFTRPNWGFALAWLPLPWIVNCGWRPGSLGRRVAECAAGAVVLLALAAAGFAYQAHCATVPTPVYLYDRARALVCWHVPMVRVEIERRLRLEPPDPQRPVLAELVRVLDDEIIAAKTRGSGSYPSLPFDPDYLYSHGLPEAPLFAALTIPERSTLCATLFRDALRRHPELYVAKVYAQMRLLFVHPYQKPNIFLPDVRKELDRSSQALADNEVQPRYRAAYAAEIERAHREIERPWPSASRLALSIRSVIICDYLTWLWGWCLAGPMLLCALAAGWPRWRKAVPWKALVPALCVAAWSAGCVIFSALSSAVTQGLDVQRYLELSVPLTLLAQLLWPLLGAALLAAWLP